MTRPLANRRGRGCSNTLIGSEVANSAGVVASARKRPVPPGLPCGPSTLSSGRDGPAARAARPSALAPEVHPRASSNDISSRFSGGPTACDARLDPSSRTASGATRAALVTSTLPRASAAPNGDAALNTLLAASIPEVAQVEYGIDHGRGIARGDLPRLQSAED